MRTMACLVIPIGVLFAADCATHGAGGGGATTTTGTGDTTTATGGTGGTGGGQGGAGGLGCDPWACCTCMCGSTTWTSQYGQEFGDNCEQPDVGGTAMPIEGTPCTPGTGGAGGGGGMLTYQSCTTFTCCM